jgi:dTDP-4-dehydrorhamnose reductase
VKALVTGVTGQLGRELIRRAPAGVALMSPDRSGLDLTDCRAVQQSIEQFAPNVVINAAAYTAVDEAESQPDRAQAVNATAPEYLAQALLRLSRSRLIQVSTDYVFDGDASLPYRPGDPTGPRSVYGRSKLAGELAATRVLGERALVLRTAWVYSTHGRNFLLTMLRLMRERGKVRVVADQIGCPNAAASIAAVLWSLAGRSDLSGTHHWSDAGVASWYDFAVAIAEEAVARGLLPAMPEVEPIATAEYPAVAPRPRFSLLDGRTTAAALALKPIHWRTTLRSVMDELTHA